jgi:hypothetical protein
LVLEGGTEDDARRRALASLGTGWTILEIEQSDEPASARGARSEP